jgi:hypothetical protein
MSDALTDWWNLDPNLHMPADLPAEPDPAAPSSTFQNQLFQSLETSHFTELTESPDIQSDPVSHSLTPGQASLFSALFSLSDQPTNPTTTQTNSIGYPPTQLPIGSRQEAQTAGSLVRPEQDETEGEEKDEDEDVKQIIRGTIQLDMNTEGNTLPYVLESCRSLFLFYSHHTTYFGPRCCLGHADSIRTEKGGSWST